jgi:hypothetical protein
MRRGFGEVYVTHVKFAAQMALEEHRALSFSVITGMGSRQRSTFVLDRGEDEKQATPVVSVVSLEQQ